MFCLVGKHASILSSLNLGKVLAPVKKHYSVVVTRSVAESSMLRHPRQPWLRVDPAQLHQLHRPARRFRDTNRAPAGPRARARGPLHISMLSEFHRHRRRSHRRRRRRRQPRCVPFTDRPAPPGRPAAPLAMVFVAAHAEQKGRCDFWAMFGDGVWDSSKVEVSFAAACCWNSNQYATGF